ncbi:conserved hypothetical protein, partial [Ricinus communis]
KPATSPAWPRRSRDSGSASSPPPSTPTGPSCTTCAAPARPGAPSTAWMRRSASSPATSKATSPYRTFEDASGLRAVLIARNHGPVPTTAPNAQRCPSRHQLWPWMNTDEPAALCNSRRLFQPRPRRRRLAKAVGSRRRHRVQPSLCLRAGRGQRARRCRDHLRDARAHRLSQGTVRQAAEAEAALD